MKREKVFLCCIAAYFLALITSVSIPVSASDSEKVSSRGFSSATVCRNCHTDIYNNWKNSLHAASISDPIFQAAFMQSIRENGESSRQLCLQCHSPTTRVTGDYSLKADISSEGITCSFCHTITAVDLSKDIPEITNEPGDMIRGPFSDASSPAHNIAPSNLYQSAEICGSCHEFKGKSGVPILSTYSEWKESPYSKDDIQCQNCHMPELFGVPDVNPEIKKTNHFAKDHAVQGGSSQIKLSKAATVFSRIKKQGNKIVVNTTVTNKESGHKLPTGMPSRKVILTVSLEDLDGKEISSQSKTYEKVLIDESGNILKNIPDMLLKSYKVLSDNRIAPKETRNEVFEFAKPENLKEYAVNTTLQYQSETPVLTLQTMKVEIARDSYSSGKAGLINEQLPFNFIIIISFIAGVLITFFIYRAYSKYTKSK